jgi:hypothetical protein
LPKGSCAIRSEESVTIKVRTRKNSIFIIQ